MRPFLFLLPLVPALAGCGEALRSAPGTGQAFERNLSRRLAGPARACVTRSAQDALQAVDSRILAYRSGAILWVNRLDSHCPSLDPHGRLIVHASPDRYCRGDRVQSLATGAVIPGPVCTLSDFTPYRLAGDGPGS